MKISKVVLRRMSLDFKVPFRTSFGLNTTKDFSIVEIHDDDGNVGYGACSAFMRPWYNEETTMGAIFVIQQYLIPALFDAGDFKDPEFCLTLGIVLRAEMQQKRGLHTDG